jgi:hypothetical protein
MSLRSQTTQWQSPMALDSQMSTPTMTTPTVTSPTSAPKSSSDKERRPKLRASCDACAASKVKCNKASTACQGSTASLAGRGRGIQTARHSSRPRNNDLHQTAANLANLGFGLSLLFKLCQVFPRLHPAGLPTGRLHLACLARPILSLR